MNYKALVLDLDGTLMSSKNEILPETKKALLELQEKGITLILASGRPTFGMLEVAKELRLKDYNGYILSYNGGNTINMADGQIVSEFSLDIDVIHTLYDESLKHKTGIITYSDDAIITPKRDHYIELESEITGMALQEVSDFKTYVQQKSVKCLMTGEPEHIKIVQTKLHEQYQDHLAIYRSQPFFLELAPLGVDKGQQLLALLNMLNIDQSEVITCGDGYNDISMTKVAGLGVAMGNGCDEIKQIAHYVTASNDNNGIVEVIQKFF